MSLKGILVTALAASGLILLGEKVNTVLADIKNNLKIFFDTFRIYGFVKDPQSGKFNGNVRANFDFTAYNYSHTTIAITSLNCKVEYLQDNRWFPIGISPTLVPKIDLPAQKSVPVKNVTIDFNVTEIIMSNLVDLLKGKAVNLRIASNYDVYGVGMSGAPMLYSFKFGPDTWETLKSIFLQKKVGTLKGLEGVTPGLHGDLIPGTFYTVGMAQDKNQPPVVNGMDFKPLGLGFAAKTVRNIKPGNEYNSLIGKPTLKGANKLIRPDGTVPDTLVEINRIVNESSYQVAGLAKKLKAESSTLLEFCKKLYDFCYTHIQYKLDAAGKEELRQPGRTWQDRASGVDCDCFAIFCASILKEAGYPCDFRVVKIGNRDYFQHIYVIVPANGIKIPISDRKNKSAYYVVDPVMDISNSDPERVSEVMDVKRLS